MSALVSVIAASAASSPDIVNVKRPRAASVARAIHYVSMKMSKGTVKWFNATKGYGFIQPEDGSKDVFVHISAVERAGMHSLNEGDKISYEVQAGRDGKSSAENLVTA